MRRNERSMSVLLEDFYTEVAYLTLSHLTILSEEIQCEGARQQSKEAISPVFRHVCL